MLLSGAGLICSAPLWLIIPALIKIQDGGPVFFTQERVGRDGRQFLALKFRSMIADAEAKVGPMQAGENDPRVTRLLAVTPNETGNWSWDELVGILNDTLLRAKLRAIEPALLDTQKKPELGVLLPAIMSTYSQQGLDISLDYRNNISYYAENLPLTSLG